MPLVLLLSWTYLPLCADEPTKKEETKPFPVEARLIVKKSKYVRPKEQQGKAFRKRIEEETDTDKLPASPKVDLVLELKNVSQEDVMIWPGGGITAPDMKVVGSGMGLKKLPLLPDRRTMHSMAKAGVTVYETAVENSRPEKWRTADSESLHIRQIVAACFRFSWFKKRASR